MASRNGIGAKLLIIIGVLIINSLGVLYLSRNNFKLPEFLNIAFEFAEAKFYEESEHDNLSRRASHSSPAIFTEQNDPENKAYSEVKSIQSNTGFDDHAAPHAYKCLDKVKPPERKTIYTWTDGKGVKHISDSPRKLSSSTSVKVAKIINPDEISLNFLSHNLPFDVQRALRERVQDALDVFALVTPAESMTPVVANIRSFSDQDAYEKYSKRFNFSMPRSSGFYLSGKNESVILIRDNEQTLQTLTHEVMHTINRHWYGQMAKWLNEGMAEYSESSKNLTKSAWVNHFKSNQPLALTSLFEGTSNSWHKDSHNFYASSWAFVAFLMNEDQDLMSRLLLLEGENGCKEVSVRDIQQLYGNNIEALESGFRRWFRKNL